MRLTAKERILLHLLESVHSGDEVEVPTSLTQDGVARGTGIELRHLAQFVRPLIQDGYVRERTAHVTGRRQRMKVYSLTPSGRTSAIRLREKVQTQVVRIRDGDAVREESLHRALQGIGTRTSLLEAIRQVERVGVLDLEVARRPPQSGLVEQLWDAPRLTTFLGRREELAEITREDGSARVFMVRGMPGIGKTALAAKACDLVRGRRNLFWHRIRPWESNLSLLANLGLFLDALDRPGLSSVLKRGEPGLAGEVLRQDLPDTHALLVLDDAHEASPETLTVIRMLTEATASAPDVKLMVLSRRALPFYDARDVVIRGLVREFELDGLKPVEAAALLTEGGDSASLVGLGRRLGGHPLLIELVRRHRSDLDGAIRDVHRFIEGTIYSGLSEAERVTMKAASLYRVPVPRTTLLATPGSSYEALIGLQDRSLIRFVARERYELHDTIRDFFRSVLTPEEDHRFGILAVERLRELAGMASAEGDLLSAVAFLSNALQVAGSSDAAGEMYESLGDASDRIGDVLGMSTAYREALAIVTEPEPRARLHRKLASALERRGQNDAAATEAFAGFDALGNTDSLERGWLELVRARIAWETSDPEKIWDAAERARRIFVRFGARAGEAKALLELGKAALWTGRLSSDGSFVAEQCYNSALELAGSLADPTLEAEIHLASVQAIGFGSGDFDDGMRHLSVVESSPAAMADPLIAASFHLARGWFVFRLRLDFSRAESDFLEAQRIARKTHDVGVQASTVFHTAVLAWHRGRYAEAASLLEQAGSEMARSGLITNSGEYYGNASFYYLVAGDWDGYRRVETVLHGLPEQDARGQFHLRGAGHDGLDAFVRGDVEGCQRCFREVFRRLEELPVHSLWRTSDAWICHFMYAPILRAQGQYREAAEQLRLAEGLLRAAHNRQGLAMVQSDIADRLAQTLRARVPSSRTLSFTPSRSASARGSPTPSTSRRRSGRPGNRGGT